MQSKDEYGGVSIYLFPPRDCQVNICTLTLGKYYDTPAFSEILVRLFGWLLSITSPRGHFSSLHLSPFPVFWSCSIDHSMVRFSFGRSAYCLSACCRFSYHENILRRHKDYLFISSSDHTLTEIYNIQSCKGFPSGIAMVNIFVVGT